MMRALSGAGFGAGAGTRLRGASRRAGGGDGGAIGEFARGGGMARDGRRLGD